MNFASKKLKLDNEETEPSNKNFNDLSEEEQSFEQSLILIMGAKSTEQLKSFTKNYFSFTDEQFICIACGSIFQLNTIDSAHWSRLKFGLKRHLTSQSHVNNSEKFRAAEQQKEQELAEAKHYAMNCAKAAYLCYKDNICYDSYPYILQLMHTSGGQVGHQQHSRAFATKFLPVVSNVIRETICEDVKKRPFGITADKITTLGRTRHIFGLRISQLNNMATEKCAEDIYLSHSVVCDLTKQGLASHLIQCLVMFGLNKMQI